MVHFVGAGCGAPDLITRRGAALLHTADCIIYAGSLVNPALLGLDKAAVLFTGDAVTSEDGTQRVPLASIAAASQCGNTVALEATVTHSSEISPPPFMVGAAEVEVDLETGEAQVVNYVAAVDCGTPVNPNLAAFCRASAWR